MTADVSGRTTTYATVGTPTTPTPPASNDPSGLFGLDILIAPLTIVAFICAALGYAAKEYRSARTARVAELEARVALVEKERDDALADTAQISVKLDALREEVADVKETSTFTYEALYARHAVARRMLIDKGMLEKDLP